MKHVALVRRNNDETLVDFETKMPVENYGTSVFDWYFDHNDLIHGVSLVEDAELLYVHYFDRSYTIQQGDTLQFTLTLDIPSGNEPKEKQLTFKFESDM